MEIKDTISRIFFVNMLGISREDLKGNGLINAYIGDVEKEEHYKDALFLLFKPKDITKFRNFLDEQYDINKSIIEDYDYPDGYTVVVYKMHPKWKEDVLMVKTGKYSKTSPAFQKSFPKVIKLKDSKGLHKDELALQHRIFNKTPDLTEFWEAKFGINFEPNMEVWGGWNEENEILNINKFTRDE